MSTTPETVSLAQKNAAAARAVYHAYNARDYDRVAALVTDDAEVAIVPFSMSYRGPAGMRDFQRGWATAFPDSRTEIRTLTADDDRVVVECIGRGTHEGPLVTPTGTIAPTGSQVEVPFCDVFEMRGGKIARARSYFDAVTMMAQLDATDSRPSVESENVALARRWFDVISSGELDAVQTLFAPTYRLHYPDLDSGTVGPEVIRGLVGAYRDAFPDLSFTVDDTIASGELVVVRWTAEGTNRGSLLGAPATSRFARWTGTSVLRIRDGRIVEDWVESDRLGMLQQLGLAPTPAVAGVA